MKCTHFSATLYAFIISLLSCTIQIHAAPTCTNYFDKSAPPFFSAEYDTLHHDTALKNQNNQTADKTTSVQKVIVTPVVTTNSMESVHEDQSTQQ